MADQHRETCRQLIEATPCLNAALWYYVPEGKEHCRPCWMPLCPTHAERLSDMYPEIELRDVWEA